MLLNTPATFVDKTRKRFKYKCPSCDLTHISQSTGSGPWAQLAKGLVRKCPKTKAEIMVAIKKEDNSHNGGECEIPTVPTEGCTECNMTGEITMFTSVRVCGCCKS